jgi:hypothetical protein
VLRLPAISFISQTTNLILYVIINSVFAPLTHLQGLCLRAYISDSTTMDMLNPQLRELSIMSYSSRDTVSLHLKDCTRLVKLRVMEMDPCELLLLPQLVHLEDLDAGAAKDDLKLPSGRGNYAGFETPGSGGS